MANNVETVSADKVNSEVDTGHVIELERDGPTVADVTTDTVPASIDITWSEFIPRAVVSHTSSLRSARQIERVPNPAPGFYIVSPELARTSWLKRIGVPRAFW